MPLLSPSSAALLLWLAGAALSDTELSVLRSSIRASEAAGVETDVGGLGSLPTFRIDARLLAGSSRLEGVAQLSVTAEAAAAGLDVCVRADRSGAATIRGEVVSLGASQVAGRKLKLERTSPGRYRIPPVLTAGARVELEIPFAASLVPLDFPRSFDARSRGHLGRYDEHVVLAGFHPELCTGGPGVAPVPWDSEPEWGVLGNYFVSLSVPAGYRVAGSGIPLGEIPGADGSVRVTRAAAAVRGIALVALKDGRPIEKKAGGIALVATARASEEEPAELALEVIDRALRRFGRELGALPWARHELVVLPTNLPCIAFSGLTVCGHDGVRGGPSLIAHGLASGYPANVRASREYELGHAIVHQWFGGLIGTDNQAHPELDEPLATFLALQFAERHLKGPHCVDPESFLKVPWALHRIRDGVDGTATRPLSAYGSRSELIALLHGKGGLYHRALRKTVGAAAWSRAVRRYAREQRFRVVQADVVYELVRAGAPRKARELESLRTRHLHGLHAETDLAYELPP